MSRAIIKKPRLTEVTRERRLDMSKVLLERGQRSSLQPLSSPDLSVLDYYWWGVLAEKTNSSSHPNLNALRASIREAWVSIPRESIIRAASAFRCRLEKCVAGE